MQQHDPNLSAVKRLVWLIFIGYSACLLYWMLWGFGRTVLAEIRLNLVPLKTIMHFISTMSRGNTVFPIINLAGNIGVFVPFGVMLPYLFAKLRNRYWFTLCFIGAIIVLEIGQVLLRRGTGDVDDVILNAIGGMIGYFVYDVLSVRRNNRMRRPGKPA